MKKMTRKRFTTVAHRFAAVMMVFVLVSGWGDANSQPIPGAFSVGQLGEASYRIDIKVPPGAAGLEPAISINMSSRAGNGLLGVGWSLGGLSRIDRCPPTSEQDGIRSAVLYTASDRYCLDGQRLMLISGTYGEAGSEYRTEIDNHSKITALGSAPGGGPSSFLVKTKSGMTLEFGNTTDSAVKVNGKSPVVYRAWAINKSYDRFGNTQAYSYTSPTPAEHYPSRIDYTSNSTQALQPTSAVLFSYEPRTDAITAYRGGYAASTLKRLSKITTRNNGTDVSVYSLAYEYGAGGQSRITGISLCAADGTCAPTTSFAFKPAKTTFLDRVIPVKKYDAKDGGSDAFHTAGTWFPVDVNRDGKIDFVHFGNMPQYYTWKSMGDGTFDVKGYDVPADYFDLRENEQLITRKVPQIPIDINGDGYTDLLAVDRGEKVGDKYGLLFTCYIANTKGGFEVKSWAVPPSEDEYQSSGSTADDAGFIPMDINGDGYMDLLHIREVEVRAYLSNGDDTFRIVKSTQNQGIIKTDGAENQFVVFDIDADGLQDIFQRVGDTKRAWWKNRGDGSFDIKELPASSLDTTNIAAVAVIPNVEGRKIFYHRLKPIDINGDGLVDLIHGTSRWINKGDGTFEIIGQQNVGATSDGMAQMDVNGDGLIDGVTWIPTKSNGVSVGCQFLFRLNKGDGSFTDPLSEPIVDSSNVPCSNSVTVRDAYGLRTFSALSQTSDVLGKGIPAFVDLSPQSACGNCIGIENIWTFGEQRTLANLPLAVANGIGGTIRWSYETLPALLGRQYFADLANDATAVSLIEQSPVVAEVERNAGFGFSANQSGVGAKMVYSYGALRAERKGRFLGFRWIESRDAETGIVQREYMNMNHPYIGRVTQIGRGTGSGSQADSSYWSNLALETTSWDCVDPATAGECVVAAGHRYLPYAREIVTTKRDLDGTPLPGMRTTNAAPDAFGNVPVVTSTVLAANGANADYSAVVTRTFYNDPASWTIGLLVKEVTQRIGPAVPSVVVPGTGGLPNAPSPPLPPSMAAILAVITDLLLSD